MKPKWFRNDSRSEKNSKRYWIEEEIHFEDLEFEVLDIDKTMVINK